jgi:dienelactone hydrolase
MSGSNERDAALREIAKKRVKYQLTGMETLHVRRDLVFRSASGAELPIDVYYPSLSSQPVPLVIMPLAYPDPRGGVRHFGPLTSWAQLVAASGMAAILYGTEAPDEDTQALLRYLRADAAALHLDSDRFGVFAVSGHVTVALSTLMRDRHLKCAALMYGYTMDLDGATAIADIARQFGFANACAGKSLDDLPADVPILFVRAGQDQSPGLNAALDTVIVQALARNLPISLINHAGGAHGFDVDEETTTSRGIVQQVLMFLRLHLHA